MKNRNEQPSAKQKANQNMQNRSEQNMKNKAENIKKILQMLK